MTEDEERAMFLAAGKGDKELEHLEWLLGITPEEAAEGARLFYHAFMVTKDKTDDAQGT